MKSVTMNHTKKKNDGVDDGNNISLSDVFYWLQSTGFCFRFVNEKKTTEFFVLVRFFSHFFLPIYDIVFFLVNQRRSIFGYKISNTHGKK